MNRRHIILTIAAIAVLFVPATALAQPGSGPGAGSGRGPGWGAGHGPHGGGAGWHGDDDHGFRLFEHMLPRLAEELGLNDQQLEQIRGIIDQARPQIESYAKQLREGREAYRAAEDDPTDFDAEAYRTHAQAQHALQTELGVIAGQARADALKVLTPEQLAQLEEMRSGSGGKAFRHGGGRRSGS